MIKSISIKDILITGNFGDVKLGMSKNQVLEILGQPTNEAYFSSSDSGSLYYGWYEFFYKMGSEKLYGFINSKLSTFGSIGSGYDESIYFRNETFEIDHSFINTESLNTNRDVKSWLKKNQIQFREKEDISGNAILEFPSGVNLAFINTDNYFYIDENNKVEQIEALSDKNDYILEGIRHYNFEFFK